MSPTHYCTGDVIYLFPLKKNIPGNPIDVVAVNYAVFTMDQFRNEVALWVKILRGRYDAIFIEPENVSKIS